MALVHVLQLLALCQVGGAPGPSHPCSPAPPDVHPKPRLEVQPAEVVTPGINVTLRCQAPRPAGRFALFRSGEMAALQDMSEPAQLADFLLGEVTPAQGGSYHCCYQAWGWAPGVWSQPSDVLDLLVTAALPRPSLVLLPGAPGTLRCAGGRGHMSFALYRAGLRLPLLFRRSALRWADFPLPGPGTYSCYYHTPAAPYVLSPRSAPLRLPQGSSDYTRGNLVRLGLAGLVLVSLATLVALDWRSRSLGGGSPLPGPPVDGV
ncbi:osteoclast-associated immunoglobulin-like receptor [Erinaceus europaeus]|uniref:Osteoclast-associated immunoglobulin-like receptor n=1 Tax=Erinaceus europaeus TaxID=9365 RepID=A0ABM3X0Z5_ERIEU|nr:osteoclast-associated immunoglobulin-like receptor [Erinaceus europaeus]